MICHYRVQKLEEKLERRDQEDEVQDTIGKTLKEAIASEFAQLQLNLDSCKDCVEEGISRLEKREYPARSPQSGITYIP